MLGAIFGDIVGSTRELYNIKSKDFELLPRGSRFTDDTVMTLAVARWLMEDATHSSTKLVTIMQDMGRCYSNAGYGGSFIRWIFSDNPQPYNSWGNGSAMRVSPVGLIASNIDEALQLAKITASVTHNHPEGIKGAQAIAACVFLNRLPGSLDERKRYIKDYVERTFNYDLSRTLDEIRSIYKFDVSCQGSVPEAIIAFLEAESLEDCARNAVSIGGDSDTIAAMACSIFAAGKSDSMKFDYQLLKDIYTCMDEELLRTSTLFSEYCNAQSISVDDIPKDYEYINWAEKRFFLIDGVEEEVCNRGCRA